MEGSFLRGVSQPIWDRLLGQTGRSTIQARYKPRLMARSKPNGETTPEKIG